MLHVALTASARVRFTSKVSNLLHDGSSFFVDANIESLLERRIPPTNTGVNHLLEIGECIVKTSHDGSGPVAVHGGRLGFHLLVVVSFGTAYRGRTLSRNEGASLNGYSVVERRLLRPLVSLLGILSMTSS